jgi:hypothetical protein
MSNEFKHGQRHSRYFMTPVWIALALCGMGVAFVLGGYLIADDWSRQDKTTLDAYKTASPSSALELAAEAVKHDRIEFGVYRDLLRATLAEQDARARSVAFRSIRDVLQYGGAFADDLKAELKGMAPQVFITTTTSKAGIEAGNALEAELRDVGMAIVNREARDPAQIGESKVSCYGADTCKDAKTLVPLLRGRGYALGDADTSSRSEDNSDDMAATLYGAKVIRVALMDPKQTQSAAATPHAPSPKPHAGKQARRTVKKPVQTANR